MLDVDRRTEIEERVDQPTLLPREDATRRRYYRRSLTSELQISTTGPMRERLEEVRSITLGLLRTSSTPAEQADLRRILDLIIT